MKVLATLLFHLFLAGHLLAQSPFIVILGNVQDGGSPHIGCSRECCSDLHAEPNPDRMVVSLGLIDPGAEKRFLFEATPDLPEQLYMLNEIAPYGDGQTADGIWLTHAHIGHYSGLMYLGKEALNSSKVPVHAMPRMASFLRANGPWDQLISLGNIEIKQIRNWQPIAPTANLKVTPIQVPHRDEYSETVGYHIEGPSKKALFIPDIDKWNKWEESIVEWIGKVDYAFIDGSFFDGNEIVHRNIEEIPHPSVRESMEYFESLGPGERSKIFFIHFNHTNPLLNSGSDETGIVLDNGFGIARLRNKFEL